MNRHQENLLYLLGYCVSFILECRCLDEAQLVRKEWLLKSIKNVVYFGKDIEYGKDEI
jgi:hypothetical protein